MSRGRPWADQEIDRMFELQAQGLSYRNIGKALGRSHGAIECKLQEVRGHSGCDEAAIRAASDRFGAAHIRTSA